MRNFAEGFGRFTDREFRHHGNIAHGSLSETQCLLLVARDLGYLTSDEWQPLHQQSLETLRPLQGLMKHLKAE